MLTEQAIDLTTDDGVTVSLWRLQDDDATPVTGARHVFLTHGTFSDKRICQGLAKHLTGEGCICWTLEWRGHGRSPAANAAFDFETVALLDVKAALAHLVHDVGVKRLHAVTHSGGGLVLAMCLARHPQFDSVVQRMVVFACQAAHAAVSSRRRLRLRTLKFASRLWGAVPGRSLGLGVCDESHFMMRTWFDWNIGGRFVGRDGFDYAAAMSGLTARVLSISGAADRLISPPVACRQFLQSFGGAGHRAIVCGRSTGFRLDYDHTDILMSRSAADEIWPVAAEWLATR